MDAEEVQLGHLVLPDVFVALLLVNWEPNECGSLSDVVFLADLHVARREAVKLGHIVARANSMLAPLVRHSFPLAGESIRKLAVRAIEHDPPSLVSILNHVKCVEVKFKWLATYWLLLSLTLGQ